MPVVSVVTPVYYSEAFLDRAVASVLRQTLADWELLIPVDDGQDYVALLSRLGRDDPRIRVLSTGGVGVGIARARNVGLRAARGEVVVALDSDDAFEPTYLETVVPAALAHGACYTDNRYVDHITGEELPDYNRPHPAGPVGLTTLLTSKIQTYTNICFNRTRVPIAWFEQVSHWEDVVFCVMAYDYLESLYHIPGALYAYYRRRGSVCNTDTSASEFHFWCGRIVDMLRDGSLPVRNADSRVTLLRFLRCRARIEEMFEQGLKAGLYRDYLEFVGRNLPWFYTLDVADLPPHSIALSSDRGTGPSTPCEGGF